LVNKFSRLLDILNLS